MDRCTNRERERKRERDCIGRRTIWTDVQIERERERERETALEGEQYGQMYK